MTTEEAIDMLECLIVEAKLGIDSIKNLPMVETQNHLPSNMMLLGDFIIIRHRDDRTQFLGCGLKDRAGANHETIGKSDYGQKKSAC